MVGEATPIEAAQRFVASGGPPGYQLQPNTRWQANEAGVRSEVVRIQSGDLTLHVVQLSDKTRAVDSGERCGHHTRGAVGG